MQILKTNFRHDTTKIVTMHNGERTAFTSVRLHGCSAKASARQDGAENFFKMIK